MFTIFNRTSIDYITFAEKRGGEKFNDSPLRMYRLTKIASFLLIRCGLMRVTYRAKTKVKVLEGKCEAILILLTFILRNEFKELLIGF